MPRLLSLKDESLLAFGIGTNSPLFNCTGIYSKCTKQLIIHVIVFNVFGPAFLKCSEVILYHPGAFLSFKLDIIDYFLAHHNSIFDIIKSCNGFSETQERFMCS